MRGPTLASTSTEARFGLLFIADIQFAVSDCTVLTGRTRSSCWLLRLCDLLAAFCSSRVRVSKHEWFGMANTWTETFPRCQTQSVLCPSLWAVWLMGCPSPDDMIWCDRRAGWGTCWRKKCEGGRFVDHFPLPWTNCAGKSFGWLLLLKAEWDLRLGALWKLMCWDIARATLLTQMCFWTFSNLKKQYCWKRYTGWGILLFHTNTQQKSIVVICAFAQEHTILCSVPDPTNWNLDRCFIKMLKD